MRTIELTQGYSAMIDDEDFDFINQWKWYAHKHRSKNVVYAERSEGDKIISMHRAILRLTDKKLLCDHRDRNGLNNQKGNLRIATVSQNSANRAPFKNSTSKFIGVHWNKKNAKWRAQIGKDWKQIYLGYYDSEIEAALAYNKAAIEIHGEFANLNAPGSF